MSMRFRLSLGGVGKLQREQKRCVADETSYGIYVPLPTKHWGGNVPVWIGYNQSLRPCQSGLTLNMDITAAAFLEGQPMLQLIGSTVGMQNVSGGLNPGQVRSINKAIRGVQVFYQELLKQLKPVQPCKMLMFDGCQFWCVNFMWNTKPG